MHAATQEMTSAHLTVYKPLIHYHWLSMNVLLLPLLSSLKGHVQYVHWIRVAANIHTYITTYIIHYHWLNMNVYISHKCDNLLLLLLSLLKGHVQYVHWTRVSANIHTYINTYMIHYHWLKMNVYISHKCDNLLLLLLSLLKGHVQYVHWTRVAANIHTYISTYMIHYHWLKMNVYIA